MFKHRILFRYIIDTGKVYFLWNINNQNVKKRMPKKFWSSFESFWSVFLKNSVTTLSSRRLIGSICYSASVVSCIKHLHSHKSSKFPGDSGKALPLRFIQRTKSRPVWFNVGISRYQGHSIIFARKFYIRSNNNKVDSFEAGRINIAHLFPQNYVEKCMYTALF